jgi:hypothetical protein
VICKECCTRLPIRDDEKKPADVLQRHALEGCERRCIGNFCGSSLDDTAFYHLRNERCPSWATVTQEARWVFIWALVNPGSNPPHPNFLPGPSFEHSQERRPNKRQTRVRGNEICADLMRDIEAKERHISALEIDLAAAKSETGHLQKQSSDKVANLENIIENLLERLSERGIGISSSLTKRLQNECPDVTSGIRAKDVQANTRALSTSTLTSSHEHYSGSDMTSTAGNMFFHPPPVSTMPDLRTGWGAPQQQMVGSDTDYYNPELSYIDATANATYPSNVFFSSNHAVGPANVTMNAQDGGNNSSKISKTLYPYK